MRVHKFYEEIEYLAAFNEEKTYGEINSNYLGYSFVFFGSDFGAVYKQ